MEEAEKSLDEVINTLNNCSIASNDLHDRFSIFIEDTVITCDKKVLLEHSKYFEAFINFNSCKIYPEIDKLDENLNCDSIEIRGEISKECCQIIVDALTTNKLNINLSNFQEVLQGAIFLQCEVIETAAVAFIISKLDWENCFRIYSFAKSVSSKNLESQAENFILNNFEYLLGKSESAVDDFLYSPRENISSFLDKDHQCCEELVYYASVAWIDHNLNAVNKEDVEHFLSKVNFNLFLSSSLQRLVEDESLLLSYPCLLEPISSAVEYHKWNVEKRVQFWRKNSINESRWPKMAVVASTGNFQGDVGFLDLQKNRPTWRKLTKKPSEVHKKAMGSNMVSLGSRVYFLGGEGCWQLAWYDLEDHRWGVAPGLPPARLLAGVAALGSRLYLIGGVTVSDGSEVVTTSEVDCYDIHTRVWSILSPLEEARSSPGVATVGGAIYVLGGLRRRHILTSCCKYEPDKDSWEVLEELPTDVTSFTVVVVEDEIVVIGGMDKKYRCVDTTYIYNTTTDKWTEGPRLNRARKSAAGFCYNGKIYVCGGMDGELKHLESTEVLDCLSGEWKVMEIPFKNWKAYMVAVMVNKPVRLL